VVADRDLSGRGLEVDFFGERVRLPRGPALLSVRTGAPILTAAVYFADGGWRGELGPLLEALPGEPEGEAVFRITQEMARAFEGLIRAAPEQWHVFQPLAEVGGGG
jgi:KDO2-lipid IV(A) lauroyltransferase